MVTVSLTDGEFIFNIIGWHKIWALKDQIKIPKENIVQAYQNKEELHTCKGFRIPGTYIPYLITAGTFYRKGNWNFWDVMNKEKTIIVELKDNFYHKLFVEVENPEAMIHLLNTKQ